jgi:hypothetical protein
MNNFFACPILRYPKKQLFPAKKNQKGKTCCAFQGTGKNLTTDSSSEFTDLSSNFTDASSSLMDGSSGFMDASSDSSDFAGVIKKLACPVNRDSFRDERHLDK